MGKLLAKQHVRGLRSRWLRSGVLLTVAVVVLFTLVFSLGVRSYYYSAVRTGLASKAQSASTFFTGYVSRTYSQYYQSAYRYTETFEDKDILELQFVNPSGVVEVSSYGISAGTVADSKDVKTALEQKTIGSWSGRRNGTGEKIMAVTAPLLSSDGTVVGAMRYVTSLHLVTRQIGLISAAVAGIGLLIILAVIVSNLYFIRPVTEQLVELTAMSRRIAEGSYGIQVQKKYDDEIGDLTDAINEMSAKIGESERVQTEFISSISHELRTPLTAITGWAETLAYDESISPDAQRGIAIISKESGRLTKMVESLLEFTRIQDGRFNLNVETLDVTAELEDAIFTYGKLLEQDGIAVEYTPPTGEIPFVLGDAERLKQVFLNIMDNAAKYGRAAGRIQVTIGATGAWVVIRFRDFGPGIPPEELPFVKKKFYKGSGKERGSGIGLAVCDEIVTRHKGKLELENAADGRTGLIVTVMLPVMNEEELTI